MNIYSLDDPLEFDFAENNGEIEITRYHGSLDYLSIPSELDGKPVAAVSGLGGCLIGAYFPGSVREISPKTLRDISCAEISSENPYFKIENDILYSGDMKTLFCCFNKKIRKFKIPPMVETVGAYAFYKCKALEFKKDLFPDGLRVIGERAFCGCDKLLYGKKKKAKLPKSIEEIGLEAFAPKKSERSLGEGASLYAESRIVFPETVKKLTCYTKYFGRLDLDRALYFRAENGVVITADGKTAVGYCGESSAYSVVIPDSVEVIDEYAFFCLTNLRSVFLGNELREIRKSAFEFCRLSSLHIPEKLEFLGENALPLQTLVSVTADENNRFFRTDGSCLYYKNELLVCFNSLVEEYFVPDETEVIRDGAFENCRMLSNLVLPKKLRRFSGMILPCCNDREAFRYLIETDIPEDIEDFSDESVNPVSLRFSDNAKTVFRHGGIIYKRMNEGLAAIHAFNDSIHKTVLNGTVVIAENAFSGCDILTSVELPDTLRRIEAGAFAFCGLKKLELPDNVEYIGTDAFEYCPLGRVFIPRNVKLVSPLAFEYGTEYFEVSPENPRYSSENGALYNKDKTVLLRVPVGFPRRKFTVPEGVTEIRGAFKSCERVAKIVLPKSLEIIRSGAFHSMKNAPAVVFRNSTAHIFEDIFKQPNECVLVAESGSSAEDFFREYKKTTALNDAPCRIKFRTLGKRYLYKLGLEMLFDGETAAVSGSCGTAENIDIPGDAGGHTVTEIIDYAFAGSEHLRSVSVADTVGKIGEGAFYRCQRLTAVRLPAQLEEVSKSMFGGCSELRRCIIPEGCKSIRANAFDRCYRLSVLGVPRSVEHISHNIFGKMKAASITVYVERGSYAEEFFKEFGKTKKPPKIIAVNSMSDIPNTEIYDLSDRFVYEIRPDGSARVFSGKNSILTDKEEFTVPEEINEHPVTSFDMFNLDPNIKRVYIPACVEEIELSAVPGAERVFIDPENKHYFSDGQAVYTKDKTVLLQFFDHTAEHYTVSEKTRKIAKSAFRGFERLTEVVLPDGLEKIGYMAFTECTSICEMNIPDSVRKIGAYAFEMGYFGKLGKINIPESLKVIKKGAFGLEDGQLFIPQNVRRIEPDELTVSSEFIVSEDNPYFSSMDGCLYNKDKTELIKYYDIPSRKEFTVPETVTVIGKCAFAYTNFVRRVILGKNVKKIKNSAFYEAIGLTYINLENVEKIDCSAFSHSGIISAELRCKRISPDAFGKCYSLERVTLIGTEKIMNDAFYQCTSLESAALPETLRAIGSGAFSRCRKLEDLTVPKSVAKIGRDAFLGIESLVLYDSLKLSDAKFLCGDIDFCHKTPRITVRSSQTNVVLFRLPSISKDDNFDLFCIIIDHWGDHGKFDFYELDNNFSAGSGFSEELAQTAICRLLYPRGLLPALRDMYFDWLRRYATETVCCFIKLGRYDAFAALEQMGLIECGDREKILDSALATGNPEITARLLEYFEKIPCAADMPELPGFDDAPPWQASSATPTKADSYPFSAPDAVFPTEINGVKITGVAARGGDIPENYSAITSLVIPEGYTSIGENAFYGCKNLRSVSLPSTLKIIGDRAFGQCETLEEIIIPDGVLSIGRGAFSSCPRLEKVRLPISLVQIGENAFDKLSPDSIPEELKWLFETEEYGV